MKKNINKIIKNIKTMTITMQNMKIIQFLNKYFNNTIHLIEIFTLILAIFLFKLGIVNKVLYQIIFLFLGQYYQFCQMFHRYDVKRFFIKIIINITRKINII